MSRVSGGGPIWPSEELGRSDEEGPGLTKSEMLEKMEQTVAELDSILPMFDGYADVNQASLTAEYLNNAELVTNVPPLTSRHAERKERAKPKGEDPQAEREAVDRHTFGHLLGADMTFFAATNETLGADDLGVAIREGGFPPGKISQANKANSQTDQPDSLSEQINRIQDGLKTLRSSPLWKHLGEREGDV